MEPLQLGTDAWTFIAAGFNFTQAIKSDGTLWAWGDNLNGGLGNGSQNQRLSPVNIATGTTWATVAAGVYHTVAVKSDGTLWAWGGNYDGQVGDGTANNIRTTPVQIGVDNKWVKVAAGMYYSAAVKSDGTLWAWGKNNYGQMGNGTVVSSSSPVQIGSDTKWVTVVAGGYHTVAVKSDGTLWTWGKEQLRPAGRWDEQRLPQSEAGRNRCRLDGCVFRV